RGACSTQPSVPRGAGWRPSSSVLLLISYNPKDFPTFPASRPELAVADYANDVLADTQWVEDHLDDDSIRIVEVDENPALYDEAHIPGAIGFDWKTDLQDQVKRDFLGPGEFGELFGSRGSSHDPTACP